MTKRSLITCDSSDEDQPVRKSKKRRKQNPFLDDEAECDETDGSNDELEPTDADSQFIDDSEIERDNENINAERKKELDMNKIALLTYFEQMSNDELANIGMKFDLTKIEDLLQ